MQGQSWPGLFHLVSDSANDEFGASVTVTLKRFLELVFRKQVYTNFAFNAVQGMCLFY